MRAAKEALHKSKSVIASAAKQSIFAYQSIIEGSPRRCTPRDDGLMQTFPLWRSLYPQPFLLGTSVVGNASGSRSG